MSKQIHISRSISVRIGQKAILRYGDTVLLLRRSPSSSRPGGWDFPGGGLEQDEDPSEGIIREITEETGVSVTSVQPVQIVSFHDAEPDRVIIICYRAQAEGKHITLSCEHDAYQWVPLSEALTSDLPDLLKGFLQTYLRQRTGES